MPGRATVWMFNLGAWFYDLITSQQIWRRHVSRFLDDLPQQRELRVLDLGCGPGVSAFVLAQSLPGAQVVGIDVAKRMIARAQAHHRSRFAHLVNLRFEQADACHLPYPAACFDVAVGHSFLYLVPDQAAVLAEVHRVLKPGGCLLLMEPAAGGSLWSAARAAWRVPWPYQAGELLRFAISMLLWRLVSGLHGRLTPEVVRALFNAAGFRDVRCTPTLSGLGMHCVGRA